MLTTDLTGTKDVFGSVKIGNGSKLHPARKDTHYGIIVLCCCPGTRQGSAGKYARFFPNLAANCRNA